MKNVLKVFAIALVGIVSAGLTACEEKVVPNDGPIVFSVPIVEFEAEGGVKEAQVIGRNWEMIGNSGGWYEFDLEESTGMLTITASQNLGYERRTGWMAFKNAGSTAVLDIIQKGGYELGD